MKKIFLMICGIVILSSVGEAQRRAKEVVLPATNPDGRIGGVVLDFGLGLTLLGGASSVKYDSTGKVDTTGWNLPKGKASEFNIGVGVKYPMRPTMTIIGGINFTPLWKNVVYPEDRKGKEGWAYSRNTFLINLGLRVYL